MRQVHSEEGFRGPVDLVPLFFIHSFFFFFGPQPDHVDGPRLGAEWELQLPAYTTGHGNTGALTHGVRPGIEPASWWILVRFLTSGPQRELLLFFNPCNPLHRS